MNKTISLMLSYLLIKVMCTEYNLVVSFRTGNAMETYQACL